MSEEAAREESATHVLTVQIFQSVTPLFDAHSLHAALDSILKHMQSSRWRLDPIWDWLRNSS